jgi:acetyl esterase/lipase
MDAQPRAATLPALLGWGERPGRPAPPDLLERRRAADTMLAGRPLPPGVRIIRGDAAGVPVLEVHPPDSDGPVILYFHGGGYRLGSTAGFAPAYGHLAVACRARLVAVDYRLAPEHPFPAGLVDALTVYGRLLDTGVPTDRLIVAGDSAGGGLAAALLLALARESVEPPAGAALFSPWADLRNIAASYDTCAETDGLFSRTAADEAAALYLAGHPAHDPLVSPALGSWRGQPPLLVQNSGCEVLRDDAALLVATARAAGVAVHHEVYPDLPHVWHLGYPDAPGSTWAVDAFADFVRRRTRPE